MSIQTRLKVLESRVIERRRITLCCAGGQYWQPVKADYSDVIHGIDLFGNPCAPQLVKVLTAEQVEVLRQTHDVFLIQYFEYTNDVMRAEIEPLP